MPTLHAYLAFDGTCAEAMRFYARVLGADLKALLTDDQLPAGSQMGPGNEGRVMHAYLVHPDFELMAGDTPAGTPFAGIQGVSLTLTYPTAAEARRIFDTLVQGGQVRMAPTETFWAEFFGMLQDRYGVPWTLNGGPKPVAM